MTTEQSPKPLRPEVGQHPKPGVRPGDAYPDSNRFPDPQIYPKSPGAGAGDAV